MAQVITRCRLTGHYMFMGMDVEIPTISRSFRPQILSVLRVRSLVAQRGREVRGRQAPLDQNTCQPTWRVGKHPAEAEPDRANLL
jgi:hypothetical protein